MVTVLTKIVRQGLLVPDVQEAMLESIPYGLFISHSMISTPAIYDSIRKYLEESGVQATHTTIPLPRNAPVAHKCVMGIWRENSGRKVLPYLSAHRRP